MISEAKNIAIYGEVIKILTTKQMVQGLTNFFSQKKQVMLLKICQMKYEKSSERNYQKHV